MAHWHAFLIEGRNFRTEREEGGVRAGRVGFYTSRFVHADSVEDACEKAIADAREAAGKKFPGSARGRLTIRPMGLREAPEMHDQAPGMRASGFILFPETPIVSDIAALFDGLTTAVKPGEAPVAPTPERG